VGDGGKDALARERGKIWGEKKKRVRSSGTSFQIHQEKEKFRRMGSRDSRQAIMRGSGWGMGTVGQFAKEKKNRFILKYGDKRSPQTKGGKTCGAG